MNKLAPPLDPPEVHSVGHSDLSPPYLHASTFSAGTTVYHHTTGSTQREPPSSFDRSSSKLQPDVSMPAEVSSTQRPPSLQELPVSNDVPANNKKEKQVDDIFLPAAAAAAAAGITTMAPPPLGDEWRGTSASLSRRSMGSSSSSRIPRHVTDETAFGSSYRGSRRVSDTRRLSQREDFPDSRCIYINNPDRTNENYTMAGNKVRTSKYTLISFVPRNLFEQFHRYAYIYFLLLVILNQIPQLAVFGRFASLIPLILVLVVTAIKDGFEDWGRHRSDRRENNRVALVLNHDGQYTYKKWKHIRVGEMVKVHANETVPCDMVLLGTSDPSGVAYVETLNLDGESNLKSRYARQETSNQHPEVGPLTGLIVCKAPDRNIYDFSAFMELPADSQDIRIPLGQNNIILRGCEVKNTSWVVGVVVYAGRETKAMLNSSGAQSKRSKLEHYMNRETGWLVVFLVVICFVGGLGMGLWVATNYDYLNIILYYKKMDSNGGNYLFSGSVGEGIFGFLSCVIRFQVMIPLSLYISLELVRLGQSYFMIRDTEMYDAGSNSKFQCRALNINEDLGQIKYLFSDKTGTLTENKMEFHTASIDGVDYSNAKVIIEPATGKIEGSITPEDSHFVEEILTKQAWKPKVGAKVDPDLVHLLTGRPSTAPRRDALFDYMLVLVACNTIVPTRVKKTASGQLEMEAVNSMEDGSGFIEYQGESPDEQALVAAAAAYGFTLLERTSANIVVNVLGEVQRYEVLGIHEFDSVRKCMSVVVECPDGTIKLLVKGADSTVLSLIGPGDDENAAERRESAEQLQWQAEVREQTLEHLDKYAREGLRTLVIASRVLTQKEVEDWHFHYAKASTALHDRVGMLRNAAGLVENNLVLLGASGIEDRLQDGVPETIALLREAGIKVWVLTGDKQETAISIGFSCLLLTQDMQQIIINESTIESCRAAIADAKRKYGILPTQKKRKWFSIKHQNSVEASIPTLNDSHYENSAEDHEEEMERVHRSLALIIDGNSLVHALSKELEQDLFELATACRVVICCRVAPLQKAGIVSLVKRRAREMTLAVGDGANDVSMIQMADVGVGISGQEGRQAVMASDFALGQFRFLKRLLLVHGHWNYQRLAYMVLYNFYRNAVFVMMLFWFILYSAFSPSSALTDWNLIFFSLLYTSVPTIVVGILDKDLSHKTLLQYPQLYAVGQRGETYNQRLFWVTMIDTLWQSLVLFYVPYFVYRGSEVDLYSLGFLFCMAVVIVVNIHLAMDINRWTWIEHAAIWISTLATFICQLVMDALTIADLLPNHWVSFHMCGELRFWFALLLTVILSLLPRFCIKILKQRIWPSDVHIAREAEILGRIRHQSQPSLELHELPPSMANSSPPSAAVSV